MKTRQGFVSNSSSSSFCILGIEIDRETSDKIDSKYKELRDVGVGTQSDISGGDGQYVGIDVTSMKDDETPRMLKQRLVGALKSIGVEVDINKVDFIEDGGYNG